MSHDYDVIGWHTVKNTQKRTCIFCISLTKFLNNMTNEMKYLRVPQGENEKSHQNSPEIDRQPWIAQISGCRFLNAQVLIRGFLIFNVIVNVE